jgi:hypothetical protein
MEGNRDSQQAALEEPKTNHAEKRAAAPVIELDAAREERLEQQGRRFKGNQDQVTPLGREEGAQD